MGAGGGNDATVRRLKDHRSTPEVGRRFEGLRDSAGKRPGIRIRISRSRPGAGICGCFVSELASRAGLPPEDWVFDALLGSDLDMGMITFMMSEENLKAALRHPAVMIGSDSTVLSTEGPLAQGAPHPRAFGTFPRIIGRYVREEKALSLEEAVYRCPVCSRRQAGFERSGGLSMPGGKADLVFLTRRSFRSGDLRRPLPVCARYLPRICERRPVSPKKTTVVHPDEC